jgi:hypothetical protein
LAALRTTGPSLTGRTKAETERATALGFFVGFGLGILALVIDALT